MNSEKYSCLNSREPHESHSAASVLAPPDCEEKVSDYVCLSLSSLEELGPAQVVRECLDKGCYLINEIVNTKSHVKEMNRIFQGEESSHCSEHIRTLSRTH